MQGRFKIPRLESFEFDVEFLVFISNVCVILHNMLCELRLAGELDDEYEGHGIKDAHVQAEFIKLPNSLGAASPSAGNPVAPAPGWSMAGMINSYSDVYDVLSYRDAHRDLTDALAYHQWELNLQ